MIQGIMSGTLQTLPVVLSPALYASALSLPGNTPAAASRIIPGSPLRQQSTGGYGAMRTLSPQATGSSFSQSQFPPTQQFSPQRATFSPVASYNQPWDVSAIEKAEADKYFVGLDPSGKGVVEGEMALPFMMASGLPTETLALVW